MVNRKKFLNKKNIGLICPSVWMKNYVIKNKIIKKIFQSYKKPNKHKLLKPTILKKKVKKLSYLEVSMYLLIKEKA